MKVLWYCPNCNKEEIKDRFPTNTESTMINLRDGYGTPIRHYLCECGNKFAGAMQLYNITKNSEIDIEYFKSTIELYNRRFSSWKGVENE